MSKITPEQVAKLNAERTQGVMIDPEHAYLLEKHIWHIKITPNTSYLVTKIEGKNVKLHQLVLGNKPGFVIDHVNHNGMDNRLINLRHCTLKQNAQNTSLRITSKSGFKGVAFINKHRNYQAKISGKSLGAYHNNELAAKIYDIHAISEFKEFANTNFKLSPDEQSDLWEYYTYRRSTHSLKGKKLVNGSWA